MRNKKIVIPKNSYQSLSSGCKKVNSRSRNYVGCIRWNRRLIHELHVGKVSHEELEEHRMLTSKSGIGAVGAM
jgi:hypothetical protein